MLKHYRQTVRDATENVTMPHSLVVIITLVLLLLLQMMMMTIMMTFIMLLALSCI